MNKRKEDWYKVAVGGMWEEIGKLQFEFLVSEGLKPEHYLLDIGCGSLRGGIHFVKYLKTNHYFGIDKDKNLLEAGIHELKVNKLIHKQPVLVQMENFEFQILKQKFDYALAQSVFTHLPLNSIIRCIVNVEKVLKPGGKLYATIFENPFGKFHLEPILQSNAADSKIISYFDKDPYHYNFKIFKWICKGTKLEVKYIGDWGHPRNQKMLLFRKKDN
ncbi:class I SAM-dependent methyltransferase [Desulfurobacterium thermolithotrophum]|uniref:class I SAM-dependent methyltransferase n=1 Tax=Desulfurobacterium thermolithotrophum TaxID=64160 RepID=UPI0013D0C34C|nr:class I SAM-dependent methyltransferase [Desulfurobacterium thermolithotrophum]